MSSERVEGMRPSRSCLPVWRPRLARLLGLVLLVGLSACGSPSPEGPVSALPTGLAAAVPQAPPPDTRHTDASHATRHAPEARVQTAASSVTPPPSDAQSIADQAQREARERWFTELRESPDAMVRLQALALWAQQPGTGIDPLPYALVDEDEDVRARAEALWEQQLAREETAAP